MERFWSKVAKPDDPDGCWLWLAFVRPDGYGEFKLNGRKTRPHRVAFELERGPIPGGLQLHHKCRNRACVNPTHLEPVTCAEHVHLDDTVAAHHANKTHCPAGHPYVGDNLYVWRGARYCRECRREVARADARDRRDYWREYRRRKKTQR